MNEPWLRGTLSDLPVVQRALLHSLEMAEEDTAGGAAVLMTAKCTRGLSNCPRLGFNCGILPAAWIGFAPTRRALR